MQIHEDLMRNPPINCYQVISHRLTNPLITASQLADRPVPLVNDPPVPLVNESSYLVNTWDVNIPLKSDTM